MTLSKRAPLAALLCSVAGLVWLAQCGPDGVRSTGPSRVSFPVFLRGNHGDGTAASSRGWSVRIEQALLAPGPLRWFEGEPLFDARRRAPARAPSFRQRFASYLSPIGVAWAHPGHYVPGEALADVTARRVIELSSGASVSLGMADGVTVMSNSATVELHPTGADLGADGDRLQGHTLVVRGVARDATRTVRFEGALDGDFVIRGVPAHGMIDGTRGWALTIDLESWFDRADFSELPAPATPDGYAPIGTSGQVFNALYRGASSALAYAIVPEGATETRDQ